MNFSNKRSRRGFSLLEMVLAIAIGGVVLAMASTQMYVMFQIWITSQRDTFFDKHIEGCERFLNELVRPSSLLPNVTHDPRMERPPGYSEFDPNLLVLQTQEASPFFYWGNAKQASGQLMVAFLFSKKEGLSLLWYPVVQRPDGLEEVYKTNLSQWVTAFEYAYFDADMKQWKVLDEPLSEFDADEPTLPDMIKVTFSYEEAQRSVWVNISNKEPEEEEEDDEENSQKVAKATRALPRASDKVEGPAHRPSRHRSKARRPRSLGGQTSRGRAA